MWTSLSCLWCFATLLVIPVLLRLFGSARRRRARSAWPRRSLARSGSSTHVGRKPAWVRRTVLQLAVHLPSCRTIADNFNRNHGPAMTVNKSWVHGLCRQHAEEIRQLQRAAHNAVPASSPANQTWGLDLTFLHRHDGGLHTVLGIIDHGSRLVVRLQVLPRKCTWLLLGHLCLAIAACGRPAAVRTDNESMFRSRLWAVGLAWMGIRHQRTGIARPWQNGRIERFFGTLKPILRKLGAMHVDRLCSSLQDVQWFYNHVRVHRHLDGRTPGEAWRGETASDLERRAGRGCWVRLLDGLLVGYYLRR